MQSRRSWIVSIAILSLIGVLAPTIALASEGFGEAEPHAPITWVGACATNLLYLPTKTLYAALGGVVGGVAFIVTGFNEDAFTAIWRPAAYGDYLITPSMLEGKEAVHFLGH